MNVRYRTKPSTATPAASTTSGTGRCRVRQVQPSAATRNIARLARHPDHAFAQGVQAVRLRKPLPGHGQIGHFLRTANLAPRRSRRSRISVGQHQNLGDDTLDGLAVWAIYRTEQEVADQGPCTRSPAISASMTTGSPNSAGKTPRGR